MKKQKFGRMFTCLIIILFISVVPGYLVNAETDTSDADSNLGYLRNVIDMIKDKYSGDITEEQLIEGAVEGMFDTMDNYTVFYTPEEADTFLTGVQGNYEGIGIMMSIKDGYITVTKVFANSPAQKAGLAIGDRIVSVEGNSLKGVSLDEAATLIKGEAGTSVKLGIIKNGETEAVNKNVGRDSIKINPVSYDINENIGTIKIDVFNNNTGEFVLDALKIMDKNNVDKIIIDLRNNPGGTVKQSVAVARSFVPEGLITKLDFKSESTPDIEYCSDLKNPEYKVAVLVNGLTASASEILAGAVQDSKSGIIIGTKTYGKSKVQNIFPILDPEAFKKYRNQLGENIIDAYDLMRNHGIVPKDQEIIGWTKITTGQYLTPAGRVIDGKGIDPDIKVEDPILIMGINIHSIQKLQKSVKPTLHNEGIDVLNAEKILRLKGYEVGIPDIVFDEKTFDAVKKFQHNNGLYPYGVLDFTTQQVLNEELEDLTRVIDKQYGKAVEVLNNTK